MPATEYANAVPARVLTDPEWLRSDLGTARRMYGNASARVLGTVRWYSISSVLVAPSIEPLVSTGTARDPALDAITLDVQPDGRVLSANSARTFSGDLPQVGAAMAKALGEAIEQISAVSGAARPALWAIAGDSISNRLLWAGMAQGDSERGTRLAGPLSDAIGRPLPRPHYIRVGSNTVVRRASCCLIYEATGGDKCVSCPRQKPEARERRLRAQLG